ncbi:MAG: prepilin-type N-terminal cleavage/methylation domain-containing protein [Deltaproteobacteria bacterium]|nr:prepilin-type N-terminal cleavage/methylation domain-containing protein [Deltaproteobacteria bacterium]
MTLSPQRNAGFTLLEILLAVFLFGTVAALIFGFFNGVVDNVQATDKTLSQYQAARTCLMRMVEDFQAIRVTLPPAYSRPEGKDDLDPLRVEAKQEAGGSFTVRFASAAHVDLTGTDRPGLARIRYYVAESFDDPDRLDLFREDTPAFDLFDPEPVRDPVLCPGVESVSFTFVDQDGNTHEEWNSEDAQYGYATPRAVEITLKLAPESEDGEPAAFSTRVNLPAYRDGVSEERR